MLTRNKEARVPPTDLSGAPLLHSFARLGVRSEAHRRLVPASTQLIAQLERTGWDLLSDLSELSTAGVRVVVSLTARSQVAERSLERGT